MMSSRFGSRFLLLVTATGVAALGAAKAYLSLSQNLYLAPLQENVPETIPAGSQVLKLREVEGVATIQYEGREHPVPAAAITPAVNASTPLTAKSAASQEDEALSCAVPRRKSEAIPGLPTSQPQTQPFPDSGSGRQPASATPDTALNAATQLIEESDEAKRLEYVHAAQDLVQRYRDNADSDLRTLVNAFNEIPESRRTLALNQAVSELKKQRELLENAGKSSMLPGEQLRFKTLVSNALEKAEAARDGNREAIPSFALGFDAAGRGATPDALTDRMILISALPSEKRERVYQKLKFIETPVLTMPSGEQKKLPLLHNGYWLGGANSGTDCSGLVSTVLPPELRQLRYTTLDLRTLHQIVRTGKPIPPPETDPKRLETLKAVAQHFEPVHIHLGYPLKPFDLLVYRMPDEPTGHVFLIESYNERTLVARVTEASQSYGGLRSRDFHLSVYPMDAPTRYLRPGMFALRIKSDSLERKCTLPARDPASKKKGGKS